MKQHQTSGGVALTDNALFGGPKGESIPMQKGQRREFAQGEFFSFAKSYLSEAFPNPQRIDCPADSDLRSMAESPSQSAHAFASQHLTCCSPCFNRYMEILADLKHRRAKDGR